MSHWSNVLYEKIEKNIQIVIILKILLIKNHTGPNKEHTNGNFVEKKNVLVRLF